MSEMIVDLEGLIEAFKTLPEEQQKQLYSYASALRDVQVIEKAKLKCE